MISVPNMPLDSREQQRFNIEVAECLQSQQESLEALYKVLEEHEAALKNRINGPSEN